MPFIIFLLALLSVPVFAQPVPVPDLHHQITDLTGTLTDAQKEVLTQQAQEIQALGQVAVLVVPTTGEETIEQYTTRVFDAWELGSQEHDDGILLLVAWQDHRVRIEVGYGLEGTLTDVQSGEIIRHSIIPAFKNGGLMAGLQQGLTDISRQLAQGDQPSLSSEEESVPFSGAWALLIWAIVLLFIAIKSSFKTLALICIVAIILAFALPISGHATGWGKLITLLGFATPFLTFLVMLLSPTPAGKAFRKMISNAKNNPAKSARDSRRSSGNDYKPSSEDTGSRNPSNDRYRGGGGSSGGGGASGNW